MGRMHPLAPANPLDLTDRFAGLKARSALALIAALAGLILIGLAGGARPPAASRSGPADLALYQRIIDDVRSGQSYYAAAVREQRAGAYPLRPFLAVRPPTLALALAALPSDAARRLSISFLALAVLLAWGWRFARLWRGPTQVAAALVVLCTGVAPSLAGPSYALHECWAGLLIALSLALRRPGRWIASLTVGLAAVSVRELAAPYLLVMAVLAWRDGKRGECAAWSAGLLAFLAGMAFHAAAVQPLLRPGDLASPGWIGLGGWPYLLTLLQWNAPLVAAPHWALAVVAPFAVLGLLARGGPLGDRLALTVLGYAAAFLIVGRPDNSYWGLVIAPLWPIGLIAAWPALGSLANRLAPRAPTPAPLAGAAYSAKR
jgi:hypothetical protein